MDKTYRIKNLIKREPLKRGRCHPLGFPPIQNPFHFNFFADFLFEINFIQTANRSHLFSLRNCDPPSDTKKPRKQLEGGKRENRFLFDFFFFYWNSSADSHCFHSSFFRTQATHTWKLASRQGKCTFVFFCFFGSTNDIEIVSFPIRWFLPSHWSLQTTCKTLSGSHL